MCLAIPGKIIEITSNQPLARLGRVNFGGIIKEINLSYVPEAEIDDYVIVHAGFALSILDPTEAEEVFKYLEEIGELSKPEEGSS